MEAAPEHRVAKLSAMTAVQERVQERAYELLGIKPHPVPVPEPIETEPAET